MLGEKLSLLLLFSHSHHVVPVFAMSSNEVSRTSRWQRGNEHFSLRVGHIFFWNCVHHLNEKCSLPRWEIKIYGSFWNKNLGNKVSQWILIMGYIHFRVGVLLVLNKNVSLLIDNLRQLAAEAKGNFVSWMLCKLIWTPIELQKCYAPFWIWHKESYTIL